MPVGRNSGNSGASALNASTGTCGWSVFKPSQLSALSPQFQSIECTVTEIPPKFAVISRVSWPFRRDLLRLGRPRIALSRRDPPREQDPEDSYKDGSDDGCKDACDAKFIDREYLHRHRRLDLCAMARGVLSGEADAGQGAGIRGLQADLDRDQRHLLRLAEAGGFSQM